MDERPGNAPPTARPLAERTTTSAGRTNGKAIASLVLGIIGVTGIPFVASIIAIILGYIARREIAEHGEEGRGLATAGIILGWVGVVLVLAGALLAGLFLATWSSGSILGLN